MSQDDDQLVERVAMIIAKHVFTERASEWPYAGKEEEIRGRLQRAARAALSAMPQRELLAEALAYAHQLEQCVAEFLDAYTAFNNDELDEVSMNDAEHGMKLAMYAFREARAAADKIRAALDKGEPKP